MILRSEGFGQLVRFGGRPCARVSHSCVLCCLWLFLQFSTNSIDAGEITFNSDEDARIVRALDGSIREWGSGIEFYSEYERRIGSTEQTLDAILNGKYDDGIMSFGVLAKSGTEFRASVEYEGGPVRAGADGVSNYGSDTVASGRIELILNPAAKEFDMSGSASFYKVQAGRSGLPRAKASLLNAYAFGGGFETPMDELSERHDKRGGPPYKCSNVKRTPDGRVAITFEREEKPGQTHRYTVTYRTDYITPVIEKRVQVVEQSDIQLVLNSVMMGTEFEKAGDFHIATQVSSLSETKKKRQARR